LLVGTTSAELGAGFKNLQIEGSSGAIVQAQTTAAATKCAISVDATNGYVGTRTNHPLTFIVNNSERARITSGGELLVGATATASGFDGKLNVFNAGVSASFKNNVDTLPSIVCWNATTSGDGKFAEFGTETSYTARGSITYNRAGGLVAYNVTSDYRAKDISGPVVDSGALIDSVPVYMGKMKGATQERPMFIAHEVPTYAHTGEKDAVDADGKPVYQQMDASALIPVMWAEIQSLRARLAAANI
jgi:hypothetical protein